MKDPQRTATVASEGAILVSVQLPQDRTLEDPLAELQGLAETAGAHVLGRVYQKRETPDSATYLGKGKAEHLAQLAKSTGADVVLFDNDLTPSQKRNLEKLTGCKVLDHTELILDIFATHARTYEARLAVELAQLKYSLPRLKRMWTHLSRIRHGIGMRGPGEKQLEEDRRLVEKRIHDLQSELEVILRRKERQVASRNGTRTVSLVGYTNAGKSTLMNALTGSQVETRDRLFHTLDTRTRRWHLPGWGPVLLSDTVGFIRNLPHHLIASFKATLEEARQADLLLHVADASHPEVLQQISAVYAVLEELGIESKDTLLLLNKIDRVGSPGVIEGIQARYPGAIPISARTGQGLEALAGAASFALSRTFADIRVEADVSNGRLLAFLADKGEVLSKRFDTQRMLVHCRIPREYLGQVQHHGGRIVEELVPEQPQWQARGA